MYYRKEIDGLRALAVLPVLLFHAGISGFDGGFVGVDIFFVISGYLITSLIMADLAQGRFTLREFYERRVRRILPALFLVMFVSLILAWFFLLPYEMRAFARSLIAVPLFASNFLFWRESDYFGQDAETIPLLHTWSLAVEEQFYILFPLLLMLLVRKKQAVWPVLVVILACSLGIAEWLWRQDPSANFYLLPSRIWELLLGALCAHYLIYKRQAGRQHPLWFSQVMSSIGLLLILYSVVYLNKSLPYPSLYALLPCLGAVFIILFAEPKTWVARWLSTPVLVGVGLISYSAYLWHQPLLAYYHIYSLDTPNLWVTSALLLISLQLAFLSWKYVEKPFRHRDFLTQKQLFILAFTVSLLFIIIALLILGADGVPERFYL